MGFRESWGFLCAEDLMSSLTESLAQSRLDETKDEVLVLDCSYVASCCALIPKHSLILCITLGDKIATTACLFSRQILYKSHNWKSK